MFSSISSYFFGGAEDGGDSGDNPVGGGNGPLIISSSSSNPDNSTIPTPRTASNSTNGTEDEWVLVGRNAGGRGGNGGGAAGGGVPTLGSLNDAIPRPTTGSTGSSASPSESGDEVILFSLVFYRLITINY